MRIVLIAVLALAGLPLLHAGESPPAWLPSIDLLERVDLRNPRVADQRDAHDLMLAVRVCRALVPQTSGGHLYQGLPQNYYLWAARQAPWWQRMGEWYYDDAKAVLRGRVLLLSPLSQQSLADSVAQVATQVADFLKAEFDLPAPRYALLVRFFDDWGQLPAEIARAFEEHRGFGRVSGLTVPPRFVILPMRLPSHQWLVKDEVLVDGQGSIRSRLTLRDLLVHELVHAHLHALLAESAESHGDDPLAADLPLWLDEGLAVYMTEKLLIEPGSKPVSYYRYSAPLHYLAEDWGSDTLRDFVRTAVLDSYATALRRLGMSESELQEAGRRYLARRTSVGRAARGYGYLVGFLLLLLGLAASPLLASAVWHALRARWSVATEEELEQLWRNVYYALSVQEQVKLAGRFLLRYRRAAPAVRAALGWRRCKLYLLARR
ncbi:MAG: hypothetical protein AB7W28_05040 [Armatimonadota bacterium]